MLLQSAKLIDPIWYLKVSILLLYCGKSYNPSIHYDERLDILEFQALAHLVLNSHIQVFTEDSEDTNMYFKSSFSRYRQ